MTEVTILVGTTKGAFLIEGGAARSGWRVRGPYCDGWPINHVVADRESGMIWAGGGGDWNGAGVWRSADGGESWELTQLTRGQRDDWAASDPGFAEIIGWVDRPVPFEGFSQVWSLRAAHGRLYAGTKPARLLVSGDGGGRFDEVTGLTDHPSHDSWEPGGAGLVLHTIVSHPEDPDRLWLAISAAGVFATEDGGRTWERRNRLGNEGACADHYHPAGPSDGELGHCVHNMVRAAGGGDLLYQQNHHGVWRSVDGGRSWDDISAGLPSTFGFPIHVHPRDPQVIWTLPLNGDSVGRYPPDAKAAVWKSADGGGSWAAKRAGLPQEACFFTVLRQAMAGDRAEPAGVYFGTNSGSVFASVDEGESWSEVARHLPTVLSVEVMER